MVETNPSFVLVRSVSPFNEGRFNRAGLRFTREWRPLQIAAVADLERGVITSEILERLNAETMLAVKPANESEVADLVKQQNNPKDDKSTIEDLRTKNADLEARLMKLELAGRPSTGTGTTSSSGTSPQPASEADQRIGLGDKDQIEIAEKQSKGKTK